MSETKSSANAATKAPPSLHGKVLLVDEDPILAQSLASLLQKEGLDVECVREGSEGLRRLEEEEYDVLLADWNAGESGGLELLRASRLKPHSPSAILFAGFGTIENAVSAMREGAFEFLSKPFVDDQMILAVRRALEQRAIVRENEELREKLASHGKMGPLIGRDHKMRKLFQLCQTVAEARTTVLIQGESGTGKTMIARAIHELSPRRTGPFVEVNCGGLPETLLETELFGSVKGAYTGSVRDKEGKFEAAQGGTIFLDEIATASPALQVKLLRVLQDRQFERVGDTKTQTCDVRVVLATNRDLGQEVRAGRFREDLYYRIHVVTIEPPPLRERVADIPLLAEHFLGVFAEENQRKVKGFAREALDRLVSYRWPGNVRELQNAIERAVVLCKSGKIGLDDLPPHLSGPELPPVASNGGAIVPLKVAIEGPERQILEGALAQLRGNRQETAKALDINRTTLFNKMRKYGLLEKDYGNGPGLSDSPSPGTTLPSA